MTADSLRSVTVERTGPGMFTATNSRGDTITFSTGSRGGFTPVELFLAAIGGCSAADVDVATTRHAEPTRFSVAVHGHKTEDAGGNLMTDLEAAFTVHFPEGEDGDRARTILPRAVKTSHDKLCTVSRTVEAGTPVTVKVIDEE
ncbi:OsmC family protein [Streptomyces sp. NPDC012746]|uniref:OsmC family protein n=1 Tax=Streptomyces sp. NPDC012746 TaxID=3364845 RepID=UPI00367BC0E6